MNTAHKPIVLAVGGLDPANCAGITADLQTIQQLGGHAYSIASTLTVQTVQAAIQSQAISAGLFSAQLRALLEDDSCLPQAAKIGAISDPRHWQLLKRQLPSSLPLVIDPVLKASSGLTLGRHNRKWQRGFAQLAERASLITPNAQEYQQLKALIPASTPVLITGQRQAEKIQNELWINGTKETFLTTAYEGEYRGTGCRLASAIAFYLASGQPLNEAIRNAMAALDMAIRGHYLLDSKAGRAARIAHMRQPTEQP